jgi:hypothetical protein
METTQSLDPLAVQSYPISRACPGRPSWVPDYRSHRPGLSVLTMNGDRGTPPYKASKGMDTVLSSHTSHSTIFKITEHSKLHCTGLHIATIDEIDLNNNEATPLELAVKINPATGILGRRTFEVLVRTLLQNDDDNDPQGLFGSSMSALSFSPTYAVDEDAYICHLLVRYFEPGLLDTDRPRAMKAARRVSELLRQFQHREDVAVGHILGAMSPLSERLKTFERVYELVSGHKAGEEPVDCEDDASRDNPFPVLPEELKHAWDKMKSKAADAVRETGKACDGRVLFRASMSTDIQSRVSNNDESSDPVTDDPSFCTKDIIGACLEDVKVSDQIWILRGASTPFVLRPRRGTSQQTASQSAVEGASYMPERPESGSTTTAEFEFAGDAFIVDFMRGEALKLFGEDGTRMSDNEHGREGNDDPLRRSESTMGWRSNIKWPWKKDRKKIGRAADEEKGKQSRMDTAADVGQTTSWRSCARSVVIA